MIRTTFALLLVGAVAWGPSLQATAPAASKDRLRRLVHLPRLNLQVGLGFDPFRGIVLTADPAAAAREMEALRSELEGHPGDAVRHARLGRLCEELGRASEARREFRAAIELYRKQGAEQSDDGVVLADFGTTLLHAGHVDEAERVLRRAVKMTPREWKPHAALGRQLGYQALKTLALSSGPAPVAVLASALNDERGPLKPTPAQADKALHECDESLACYDRAIALDPQAAEPYYGRAVARAFRGLLQCVLNTGSGSEPEALRFARAMYPPEALSDLRHAMRLAPKDPQAIGTAVMFELGTVYLERGTVPQAALGTSESWGTLPERTRRSVRDAMARLDDLSQTTDPAPAAAALEVLGTVQGYVVSDVRGAETTLRRATELDPKRTLAWETLVFLLAAHKRPDALLTVCEARLKAEESARARLLVAKAYEQLEQWDDVLDATATLQRRYPEDLYAQLAFAAALLRTIDDELAISRAAQLLSKAEKLAGNSPSREQTTNLLYLRGLLLGLAGQAEAAGSQLKQLQELDPDYAGVSEALQILEQM